MCFTSPKYTIAKNEEQMKCWNGIQKIGDNANTTRYKIDFNPDDIKNSTDTDLAPGFVETNPRLEFNYLKRNYLLSDGQILLGYQFSKNRRILVEFFMMNKSEKLGSREETRTKGGKKKNNKESKSGTSKATEQPATEPKKPKAYLHLMAIVDVSTLLYPGVTRTRVATKLRTYHAKEAFIQTGAEDSFFMPKPIEKSQSPSKESTTATAAEGDAKPKKEKKSKGSKKSSKKSAKSDKDKSSKKSGKSKKSGVSGTGKGKSESGKNLKTLLPTKPEPEPEEEPSTEVYNEDGKPCYIILEIELSEPINKKRPMEDLEEDLQSLLQSQPKTSKVMLTPCLCKDYFQESLNEILQDMYTSYGEYMQKIKHCDCSNQIEFFDYLRKTGIYQSYITSLTSAATAMITSQYRPEGELDKGSKQYRDLIEEVFIYLVSQMNFVLNKQTCTSFRPITRGPQKSLGLLLFYAREATELGNQKQADKYYMERLCNHETQPDFWFDYAVYKLEMQDPDTAFQCIYQALIYNMYHPLCLLLYGILLADFKRRDEAETCFLNLLEQHPRWLEAWAILFLFYYNYENFEGMEVALAECKKYLEDDRCYRNYFTASEDLAWTDKICPNSIFFRAASLLLKLRVYNWVENALAQELTKHYGITNYLMGAVCYYKKMYTHALEHLAVAKFHHGSDYAVASLTGHCLLAMDKLEEAKEEYYHILESYNRPEDMHLVYVNTSLILEQFDDIQESKKVILIACKNNPSPYTWWKAGALFYHLNDLLSAENCFSESNLRDNSLAEVWAYLTLINLKLQHLSEAELCYQQTTKNNLLDEELKYEIRMEYEKLKSVHPKFLCF